MKTVFLDRDGTVNVRRHDPNDDMKNYVLSWDDFEWMPGALDACVRLVDADYKLVFVSNQSCVNKKLVSEPYQIHEIFLKMTDVIAEQAGKDTTDPNIIRYIICPHTAEENCVCRKPKPGMLITMMVWDDIRPTESWMVGDAVSDMKAGWDAGIRKLIKLPSYEAKAPGYDFYRMKLMANTQSADGVLIDSIGHAVDFIIRYDG